MTYSFTRGAREEAARARAHKGLLTELIEVSRLLAEPGRRRVPQLEEIFPKRPKHFLDLPLPEPRPKSARPSIRELVESDRRGRAKTLDV